MYLILLLPDVDECNDDHDCDLANSMCVNTEGSYTCTCRPGYVQVEGNNMKCQGEQLVTQVKAFCALNHML